MPSGQPGTHQDFEVVARAIWDGLPQQSRAALDNVTVRVADFADAETLKALHIRDPYDLLGLYHGMGLPSKSVWDPISLPDRIDLTSVIIALATVRKTSLVVRRALQRTLGGPLPSMIMFWFMRGS
jgi:predicted Zn-dependent protease with MMP-like domain